MQPQLGTLRGADIDFTPRRGEPDKRRRIQEIGLAFLHLLLRVELLCRHMQGRVFGFHTFSSSKSG